MTVLRAASGARPGFSAPFPVAAGHPPDAPWPPAILSSSLREALSAPPGRPGSPQIAASRREGPVKSRPRPRRETRADGLPGLPASWRHRAGSFISPVIRAGLGVLCTIVRLFHKTLAGRTNSIGNPCLTIIRTSSAPLRLCGEPFWSRLRCAGFSVCSVVNHSWPFVSAFV